MRNEREFKLAFKKSVRSQKGFSESLAAPMVVGIPDLFVVMPGYIPVLLEAKWLKDINRAKFSRKVPFTERQRLWIKECHEITEYSCMGLIGFVYNKQIYAALVAYGTPIFDQFTDDFFTQCSWTTFNKEKKSFDVSELFARVPIPRIEATRHDRDNLAISPYHTQTCSVGSTSLWLRQAGVRVLYETETGQNLDSIC